jgi:hypothetical protein
MQNPQLITVAETLTHDHIFVIPKGKLEDAQENIWMQNRAINRRFEKTT